MTDFEIVFYTYLVLMNCYVTYICIQKIGPQYPKHQLHKHCILYQLILTAIIYIAVFIVTHVYIIADFVDDLNCFLTNIIYFVPNLFILSKQEYRNHKNECEKSFLF